MRADRLAVGDDPVHDLLRSGKTRCVFAASDSGAGIIKKVQRLCRELHVPFVQIPHTKEELGNAFGRASCAVCATNDTGFAASATKKLIAAGIPITETADLLEKKHERILKRRAKPRKKDAGNKVQEYIDIEEEDYKRQYGKSSGSGTKTTNRKVEGSHGN